MMEKRDEQHLILWDGDCGFCQHSVNWFKARDKHDRLYAMPYQEAPTPPMTPELYKACGNSVHVITADGKTLHAGLAALFLLKQIGWGAVAIPLSLPPLIWGVEVAYKIVAANRLFFSKVFFPKAGDGAACSIRRKPL